MRTLFGKIFLWFFCAQVLLGTAMFGVGFYQREGSTPRPVREMLSDELQHQSASAVLLAESGQLQKLHLQPSSNGAKTTIFWRRTGRSLEVIGDGASATAQHMAAEAERESGPYWSQSASSWSGALATRTAQSTIIVVREIPRPEHGVFGFLMDWKTPEGRLRLALALTVMALVCYALAYYIAAPVARLRDATQRLAEGDLQARVAFKARGGDELIALGRDFDRMAGRLQASMEAERQLLGDISHELRTPLARLTVALDLVEQNRARAAERGEVVRENVYLNATERIRRESGRLNDLISQLLELARLESRAEDTTLPADATVIALDKIVAEVVADARYEAHGRACDVELVENEPCTLRGIEPLLHSAIENVVRNAVRYTAPETNVEVALRRDGTDHVTVTVHDHGPGVPEESLEALFRPFYRVNPGRDRDSGGVGLGLAIAQRALQIHGATIEARNADGGGLEVTIHLPALATAPAGVDRRLTAV